MRAHTFALATALAGWIGTIVAPGPLAVADAATQSLVRMTRGAGVVVFPGNARYSLGQTPPQREPREVTLRGSPVSEICCPGRSGVSCVTERQVTLGASRASVLGRYGRPEAEPAGALRYAGVTFGLDRADRVNRICIGRR